MFDSSYIFILRGWNMFSRILCLQYQFSIIELECSCQNRYHIIYSLLFVSVQFIDILSKMSWQLLHKNTQHWKQNCLYFLQLLLQITRKKKKLGKVIKMLKLCWMWDCTLYDFTSQEVMECDKGQNFLI